MFYSWFDRKSRNELYNDIFTMPVYNWFKVMDENNFGYLFKSSTFTHEPIEQVHTDEVVNIWHSISNQYTKEFGQDPSTTRILNDKKEIALLETEYITTLNKFLLTQIEIKKANLKAIEIDSDFNYNQEVAVLSKYLGKPINIKTTSVYDYNITKLSLKNSVKNG